MKDRVPFEQLGELDRYMLIKNQRVIEKVRKAYDAYQFHTVYHAIHNFCTLDLSAFYLDISKDRLYTEATSAQGRRAAQTVLYDILLDLVRLVSPIIPHTADEVWKFVPGVQEISVQLVDMPDVNPALFNDELENKWDGILAIRDEINKALEEARREKVIGQSLGAAITIYAENAAYGLLQEAGNLKELFIVSAVELKEKTEDLPEQAVQFEGVAVMVQPAEGEKCERCWVISTEVGKNNEHPSLCPRCANVLTEEGQI